jgi:AcrR family transcriptional regulator
LCFNNWWAIAALDLLSDSTVDLSEFVLKESDAVSAVKQDRRAKKTLDALHVAFVDLLIERGYDALKIGDLVAHANVGRSTFYEHYRTKHDLLKASLVGPFTVLAHIVVNESSNEKIGELLKHFRQNQRLARVLLAWPTRSFLSRALTELIEVQLKSGKRGPMRPLIPIPMIASHIAEGQLALIENWISSHRPSCSAQDMTLALMDSSDAMTKALIFKASRT